MHSKMIKLPNLIDVRVLLCLVADDMLLPMSPC